MEISELKAKSRKQVALPATGFVVEIRRLSRVDFMRAEINWLPAPSSQKAEAKQANGDRVATMIEYVLENGAVAPKVFCGPEHDTPDGAIHESWIAEDQGVLVAEILAFSGVEFETQQVVDDLAKNE